MTPNILVIDIERQSGLADGFWEGKQYQSWLPDTRLIEPPRTICFAHQWLGGKTKFVAEWDAKLEQDDTSWTPGGGHLQMVEKAYDLFDEADYVVGWNSKNFDIKHLNTAFLFYGLGRPSPHIDIDLMLQIKRATNPWAKSMGFISKVRGMEGKDYIAPETWRALRFGTQLEQRRARREFKTYNIRDVDQTAELFYDLRPWITGMNLAIWHNGVPCCPVCESENLHWNGTYVGISYGYRRFQCQDCGKRGRDTKSYIKSEVVGA